MDECHFFQLIVGNLREGKFLRFPNWYCQLVFSSVCVFSWSMSTGGVDRFFNPKDGTYANVPIIAVHPEKYRGKRIFGTKVLIGNWYEDRMKVFL